MSLSIATERLLLRPWRNDEAARLFDIRRQHEVARWLSNRTPWSDLPRARAAIAEWEGETAADDALGVWAIVQRSSAQETPDPVGSLSLGRLPQGDEVEIGWYLHPDSTGHGFASEAAEAVLHHAFSANIGRVWAIMWPDNTASARVATTIGMRELGAIDEPWYGSRFQPTARVFRANPSSADRC